MGRRSRRMLAALATAVLALVLAPGRAEASGGTYAIDGGTPAEQSQVRQALNASSFPWGVVTAQIKVHIRRGANPAATAGEFWFDSDLLDAGELSWGVVQHEYAHQ